jgi:hypothetical protein
LRRGAPDETRQLFLLKALKITQDPNKLKQMLGLKTVADVYRTLDKLAMRKEYHEALAREGISFDFIVGGIKNIAVDGGKDGDKLKAYEILLKSVGMEKYESGGEGAQGSWEEALLKVVEEKKGASPLLEEGHQGLEYDVVHPEVPESVKKRKEEEEELLDSIYDSKD